jgi:hypothetical protein
MRVREAERERECVCVCVCVRVSPEAIFPRRERASAARHCGYGVERTQNERGKWDR